MGSSSIGRSWLTATRSHRHGGIPNGKIGP
jgi:hypothetical protein